MQRVFGIGLSRTGTTSLNEALNILGIKSVHWPKSEAEIAAHQGATDITVAWRFQELDREYPGSKFILTVRELNQWLNSCSKHYHAITKLGLYGQLKPEERSFCFKAEYRLYGRPFIETDPYFNFDSLKFAWAMGQHTGRVISYFQDRTDLLMLDVTEGNAWEKLCPFLELPIPDCPFPHANKFSESSESKA